MNEVCRQLKAVYGWQAGFIRLVDDPAQELQSLLQPERGCLIVLDYAETRAKEVVDLVRIAVRAERRCLLRLMLLAREGGDWWEHLSDRAQDDPEVAAVLQSPRSRMGPYRMSAADIELADRPALFREALRAFAAKTGVEVPSLPMPDLTDEAFNHMLFIHLAALAALRGKAITDQKALLVDSLRHERNYWSRGFENASVDTQYLDGFEQLVALLTLIGGTRSAAETRDVIGLTPRLRDAESLLKNQMFDLLRPLYGRDGGVSGLQPDLLGERLVADSLAKDDELIDIVFKNPKNASERIRYAYTVLTRLARQDDHERQWLGRALDRHFSQTIDDAMAVAMETGSPMPEMIASVLQAANRPGRQKIVNALRVKLPKDTVNLMELAVEVAEQHVELLVNQGSKKSFKFKLNTKDAYDLLASRYESTGHFKEAVDARRKALKFAQVLPNANRTPNRHTLAQAYLNLAVICGKTCYFDEALQNGEQAESILRTLAQAQPDVYRPVWATSLGNLAEAFLRTGDALRALPQAEHASALSTGLAVNHPKTYQEQRGWCQRVLAETLLETGDIDKALAEAHNAVTVLFEMFNERPEYAPEQYGKALEVLSRCQHDREGVTASIQTLKRAVQELGPHYERRPAVLQTVMQNIVDRLRSLAPDAAEHETPQNILDLLDRHQA